MYDLRTQAELVAFDPTRAGSGAIGTVLTRAEVAEAAAQGEFPATLLLDLDRAETEGGGDTARIAVDWDKESLDQLLASTDDAEIAIWFEERELARAFDEPDVEGHGLRERAAVLAIAVGAAGVVSATPALASPAAGNDGGPSAVSSVNPAGFAQGAPGSVRALQQAADVGVTRAPATNVEPTAVHPPGFAQGAPGAVRALQQGADLGTATQAPATNVEAPAVTSTGGLSAGEITAIAAGAGVILISAAGFGVARKRTPPAQPA